MRWKMMLSWLLGSAPMTAMIYADSLRVRVFIFVFGILFVLGSMVFAQEDGAEAQRRDSENQKPSI